LKLTDIFSSSLFLGCPRSWSPTECSRCWPSNSATCPIGWCPSSSSGCGRWSNCPKSHCPYSRFSGGWYMCENWGDCCLYAGSGSGSGSGSLACGSYNDCPRSWSSEQCNKCWPNSGSSSISSSLCPRGWCPNNWSSSCHSWYECPRSHCPLRFSGSSTFNTCDNWGDCCLFSQSGYGCYSDSGLGCPRSWSPEKCQKCWPKFGPSSSSNIACPVGWCPFSLSGRCSSYSDCPQSHCPNYFSGICDNWGDCCVLHGSGSGGCYGSTSSRYPCPRSWTSQQCQNCWINDSSKCPPGWCPENWGSRCHSWSACPRSHCPSNRSSSFSTNCENWGDCCFMNSSSGACYQNK